MSSEYELNELTPLAEAVRVLIRRGVDVNHFTMREHLKRGKLKGQKIGDNFFVLTSEIQRLQDEAKTQ